MIEMTKFAYVIMNTEMGQFIRKKKHGLSGNKIVAISFTSPLKIISGNMLTYY